MKGMSSEIQNLGLLACKRKMDSSQILGMTWVGVRGRSVYGGFLVLGIGGRI